MMVKPTTTAITSSTNWTRLAAAFRNRHLDPTRSGSSPSSTRLFSQNRFPRLLSRCGCSCLLEQNWDRNSGVATTSSSPPLVQQRDQQQQRQRLRWFSSTSESTTIHDDNTTATSKDETTTTTASPAVEKVEFKADTKKILDIMTNSLYTDKEVFLRELVSNASDALEKLRHAQAANTSAVLDPDTPLEIRIELDEVESSITITDTGIGMTRDDMMSNLGTIARSGSSQFMKDLQRVDAGSELEPGRGIIGRFGVGFYSVFMVAEKVQVTSRSAASEHAHELPHMWSSDGNGYELCTVDEDVRVARGTSVKLFMEEDYWEYVNEQRLQDILKRYSNFVGFPIYLMGRKVNTVDAIWTRDPKEVEEERYTEFYRYIANAVDAPLKVIHFRADAPLDVKALLFIPSFHSEKYGMGRMEPAVALYCRKVLIEAKSKDIIPDWLRFLKGVVDSEDLPLSVSREKPQDSALIAKLRRALTRKVLSYLTKMQTEDRSAYLNEFYREYNFFLKEGICQDKEFQPALAKLLYFESSKTEDGGEIISLDEYIARMRPEQKDIYFLCAPTREAAVNSPYMELFDKANVEVLFVFKTIDDFAMGSMDKYEDRKLVSIEKSDIDLSDLMDDEKNKDDNKDDDVNDLYKSDRILTPEESVDFCNWYRNQLKDKVASCSVTTRLVTAPAIVTGHESGSIRRMMRSMDTSGGERDELALPKQHVEVNPKHPVIVGIYDLREKEPFLARILADQVFDNCLTAAGLLDDNRSMLPRLNDLLICIVKLAKGQPMSLSGDDKDKSDDGGTKTSDTPPQESTKVEEAQYVDKEEKM
ncbi:hypothetical protein ACA910_014088 [Epithemia clementina (nom. ined.)]